MMYPKRNTYKINLLVWFFFAIVNLHTEKAGTSRVDTGLKIMENTIYRPVVRAPKGSEPVRVFAPAGSVSVEFTKVQVRRMRAALDGPSTLIPNGLSFEEMRAFILAHVVKAR